MYNITCGRRDLIISDCNVTEPSYTSDDIAPDGYIYEYTVTPRSNVEGASNGTSNQPLRGELTLLMFSLIKIIIIDQFATFMEGTTQFSFVYTCFRSYKAALVLNFKVIFNRNSWCSGTLIIVYCLILV